MHSKEESLAQILSLLKEMRFKLIIGMGGMTILQ